jgi:hypothetical protein
MAVITLTPTTSLGKIELTSTDPNAEKVSVHQNTSSIPVDLYLAIKGEKGEDGTGGDSTYEHTQSSASAHWTVEHSLGKKPAVTVIDSGGDLVLVTPTYVNDDTLTLHFSAPFSGVAYCN